MYKFTIICLGKLKEKAFKDLEKEYLKRLSPFTKINLIELQDVSHGTSDDPERVKLKEAEKIKSQIPKGSIVLLLEERGKQRDSVQFASFIERIGSIGQEVVFIIGGGLGLHDSLKEVSNYSISLSPLTFTHNFSRILLEEQLYRAITIINGKAYHK